MNARFDRTGVPLLVRRAAWLVVLFAILAYGTTLAGDFVFDDVHSVAANPALHDLANFGRYWSDPDAFSGASARMYRPALLTSFALNIAISPAAWSLKAGNLLLHAAVSALLLVWLWRLARQLRPALVVASLFAVHPLLSEAINMVSARSELLSTFGMLLALLAQLAWQRRQANAWPLIAILLGTVLACGSKATGVVLPALMAVQVFCLRHQRPRASEWRRALAAILPVVGLVVLYLIVRKLLLGQATVQLLGRTGEDHASGYGRTIAMQLATMGTLLPKVLWQTLVPTGLSLDPVVRFRDSFLEPWVLLGWGSLVGLTVAAVWPGPSARLRRIGVAVAWAIALPWIVIPLNMPMAEHRLYGPLLGFAAIGAAVVQRLRFAWLRSALPAQGLRAVFAFALVLGIVGSLQRSLLYRDECSLWQEELAQNPQSFRAWWGLGTSRRRQGDIQGSIEPLARAHALYPEHYDVLRNYVESLIVLPDELAEPYRALATSEQLRIAGPKDPWVRTLVAQANLQAGRVLGQAAYYETAERVALSCLEIAAPKGYVYQLAAVARQGLGDDEGALLHLDTSVARGLGTIGVRVDRAKVLHDLGRDAEARRELLQLQQQAPGDGRVLSALQHFATPVR